jgi:hypothetical protein
MATMVDDGYVNQVPVDLENRELRLSEVLAP